MQQAIDILEKLRNKVILRWGPNDTDATRLAELSLFAEIRNEFLALGDRWILMSEKTPDKEGEYLTCVDLSFNKALFHETCIRQLDWDGDNFGDGDGYTHNITHWQPLPLPPKQ